MLNSSAFGSFDPLKPQDIPGESAEILYAEPVEIKAPITTVWEIMVDFDRYPAWNPLNRFFRLDTKAAPNHFVTFGPSWGPYDQKDGEPLPEPDMTQKEMITVWEENCCLAYAVVSESNNAERVQHISTLDNGLTRYHTYERMSGRHSPSIRKEFGNMIIAGFTANGIALKKRAEAFAKSSVE